MRVLNLPPKDTNLSEYLIAVDNEIHAPTGKGVFSYTVIATTPDNEDTLVFVKHGTIINEPNLEHEKISRDYTRQLVAHYKGRLIK